MVDLIQNYYYTRSWDEMTITPTRRAELLHQVVESNDNVAAIHEQMYRDLRDATGRRREAIQRAHDEGIPKNQIASELNISPQRLRMLLKGGPR